MAESFQPYAESFEDSASVGASIVDEDRSGVQPSFEYDDFDHDTASIPGSFPHFPHRNMAPPRHGSR